MPSGARDIVIGGGIAPVPAFTIGRIPVIVNDDPAAASDSLLQQRDAQTIEQDGPTFILGADANDNNRTRFHDQGGTVAITPASEAPVLGADAFCIGRGATALGTRGIGLGGDAPGQDSVALGYSASAAGVGSAAILGSTSGNSAVAIGSGSASAVIEAVAVGTAADATQSRAIAIGAAAQATHQNSAAIGQFSATTKVNQTILGRDFAGYSVTIPRALEIYHQLFLSEAANRLAGTAVLVAGTVTVNNTQVTANSRFLLSRQAPGGGLGHLGITARVVGTSFTITSDDATDTSTIYWVMIEPAT